DTDRVQRVSPRTSGRFSMRVCVLLSPSVAAVLVLGVLGGLGSREAWPQDRAARSKLAAERAAVSVRAPDKPAPKEEGGRPSLNNDGLAIELQTQDIMTYLLENKGKVPLFSGMHGKMHVELGLFGYLGVKYQF